MGMFTEEYVVVRRGLTPGDPSEITVNCPDKVGLGSDLARIVFEFGLSVTKGDMSIDGRWCFVVLWVVPKGNPSAVRWSLLKQRLEDICPSALASMLPPVAPPVPESKRVLLLQVCSSDRTGLLHDVAQKLWEMELTIHKVKVSTTPDEKAIDLFFVTDNRNQLPWKARAEEVTKQLKEFLGESCSLCEINPAAPECGGLTCFPLPASMTKEIFYDDPSTFEQVHSRSEREQQPHSSRVHVTVDNNTSPVHSLLQLSCKSRKGLLYDCLRTVKDFNLKVAHGRIAMLENGYSELSVFVLDKHGLKITDVQEQKALVQSMEEEVGHPVRIKIGTRGTDTELLVATPIEKCGRGRPRVLYDVTLALKMLDICIFKADIGRHAYNEKRWEIYRFLLVDKEEPALTCSRMRNLIVDRVRQMLLG
jgi:glycine cleavage system regulatory protein